ncbi:uncharacterized protein BDR25DRAFT_338994 [Lindgomyces ingoldianus]|uniref:Uncharacterized protein n=1 Tax=Lindgomyces ingoldianus TaxID=673940 RepID=A0ACB6RDS5_9PLEO|nr:uncharacterized protein BDR25DRAFT_338994 [Lindgomyces ingoldianus]KAF2476875.1 hypothetical protein BDR25DRAFT_338994 [Lindgomyces ingoldianus]
MAASIQLLAHESVDLEIKKKKKKSKSKEKEATDGEPESQDHRRASKKRKREALPEEIEIDVNLPEPVSKKAARKAKKLKPSAKGAEESSAEAKTETGKSEGDNQSGKRSEYGVWIGNLPWSATKDSLRTFLAENSDITNEQITRVNMPAPREAPNPRWTTKPLNKGFAYVDFSTQLAMYSAIALTETKLDGRPLLIKNANNFEGRPEKATTEQDGSDSKTDKPGHPPNKRVFVGNLAFDVTKEDLQEHFGQCGELVDIHMATFEDSGKCKGYAWITFDNVEAATSAVKGYIYKSESKKDDNDSSEAESKGRAKEKKPRKWYINKIRGRDLRCEFAEDSTTRYNKRYGKEKKPDIEGVHPDRQRHFDQDGENDRPRPKRQPHRKIDTRTIKSGAAHTNAQRASQAIVEAKGKKITFD